MVIFRIILDFYQVLLGFTEFFLCSYIMIFLGCSWIVFEFFLVNVRFLKVDINLVNLIRVSALLLFFI